MTAVLGLVVIREGGGGVGGGNTGPSEHAVAGSVGEREARNSRYALRAILSRCVPETCPCSSDLELWGPP